MKGRGTAGARAIPVKLSIVIAARTGAGPVLNCLESLRRLPQYSELDIVVADCCGDGLAGRIRKEHPAVKLVSVPPGRSIAQGRDAAIRQASGDIIAVLHERYAVCPDWASEVLSAHAGNCDVAGGCVAPAAHLSASAWAMYLSEYSHIAPPMPGGPVPESEAVMFPGGNISYKRSVFSMANMSEALWELDFHSALVRAGARFVRHAGMDAEFSHPFTVGEYIAERYEVSRDYAALRAQDLPAWKAVISAGLRLALPPVLLLRMCRRVVATRYKGKLAIALPWMAVFSLVQMAGEMAGYLAPQQLKQRGVRGARAGA